MGYFDGIPLTKEEQDALDESVAELNRCIEQLCSEGCCVQFIDPTTGKDTGGWGPVGCPCQDASDDHA